GLQAASYGDGRSELRGDCFDGKEVFACKEVTMAAFSEKVLEHFRNPRNSGELQSATHRAEVTNPVCGDILRLGARVENGRIAEARFLCKGCTTAIACASVLCERMTGMTLEEARWITAEWISESLGGLPAETKHGAHLAADAVRVLLRK